MRAVLAAVVLLAASLVSPALAEQEEDAPTVELIRRSGRADPGAKLLLQVEARWTGRPERHLPGRPDVKVPRGATVRIGQTSSRFDGERTRWWTDVVVELPERSGPWTLGPATVPLKAGRLAGTELTSDELRVGRPSKFRQLLGQGVGNGAVVVAILLWLGWRWRSLAPLPVEPERTRLDTLLERARGEAPEAGLETLLQARLALAALGAEDPTPPTVGELQARIEAVRYGGESIQQAECRELLTALEAAAKEAR